MNQWQNANGMFAQGTPSHLNSASMYSSLANPNQFDLNNHHFANGNSSTPTPSYSGQTFQPGSVVPAKRPHDGMSGSPQQNQQSRSQTPSYAGFQNLQGAGQQFPNAPTPYQHLQQSGSNNATPSPTLSQQQFRQPAPQQRMQNASPSPFPQQQNNFGNQMSPGPQQQPNAASSMPQQGQMGGWNQGMGMTNNMSMAGMTGAASGQMNNMMAGMQGVNPQKAYQMKLMQQQQALQRSGMIPPRSVGGQQNQAGNFGHQQQGSQMANGQAQNAQTLAQNHQLQAKKKQFLGTIGSHAQQQNRPFNPNPSINGRLVDLYALWTIVTQAGGSQSVEKNGHWPSVAGKLGFPPAQYPMAAEEVRRIHGNDIAQYERLWFTMRAQQKQEQARIHAHQMAGLGGPQQSSPNKMMQLQNQQSAYAQMQQQAQQSQPQPQATPVQANAQLPPNGMTTPQQMMQHRRNSSVRKSEQMTPQAGNQVVNAASPHSAQKVQRSPSIKAEPATTVMKSEEPQSSNYVPHTRTIEYDGGYDVPALYELGTSIARTLPNMPNVEEMGTIDTKAIMLSLASGLHAEVRYALDALAIVSNDSRVVFDLEKCEDLLDVIVDCAEEQIELLSEEAAEVSDALDLPSYEDVLRGSRAEANTLQEVSEFGTQAYQLDRAVDKLIAITTILRNFSFYECNHRLLTSTPLIKWLSNTIRLLGTRNMLLRTFHNTQDFYKDVITFLSNITQGLELPTRDDALHLLHFLLAFAPQPSPSYTDGRGKVRFTSFVPAVHRYLPPAVDCLAKLLARQDPNRALYRSIFTASSSSLAVSESPLELLTRAFALAVSVLPDRSKGNIGNTVQLRIVEARKAYLTQGMLAADILTTLAPGNDPDLARSWIESEDGWAVGLLNLAPLLSVDRNPPSAAPKSRELGHDTEIFKLITHRALTMMKRLAEKAGRGSAVMANGGGTNGAVHDDAEGEADQETRQPKWEGMPQGHAVLGALMLPNTDKTALGLLCGLHEMAMQG